MRRSRLHQPSAKSRSWHPRWSEAFGPDPRRVVAQRHQVTGDGLTVTHALTRAQPPGWTGYARRIDAVMLEEVGWRPGERPLAYVCGPTRLVEAVAGQLVALGHDPARVRTERFGPTGVP